MSWRCMTSSGFHFDNTYVHLPKTFYSKLSPAPAPKPEMVILNLPLAIDMGLDFSEMSPSAQAALFAGNVLPDGAEPLAQAYAGHQFGHFTMLGDGRAIVLGEHLTPSGQRLDLQFKGSGRTPYSRGGDGRAALGPMLREYVISEAMHALNVPTTRSLAVVTSGEKVHRETDLPGAILTRIASSHLRVGTFQYAAMQQDKGILESLVDYTIDRHFPSIKEEENKPFSLLESVMGKQADLITHWMRVGFIHGVMNTDNVALSGETIDYGPCAFMDSFDPGMVFSSIDRRGRYAYANQPTITQWNLARFAETLLPVLDDDFEKATALAEEAIEAFGPLYKGKWFAMMRSKLGLTSDRTEDESLVTDLLDWMHGAEADYTNTFRDLTQNESPQGNPYDDKAFEAWHARWRERLDQDENTAEASLALMGANNPVVIPRNHNVEQALNAATNGDLQSLGTLLAALENPYEDRIALTPYQSPPKPEEKVLQTFCGT
jgi:serine/tyrosine/threonine adenylyltransferase